MNISIPKEFSEVDEDLFWILMKHVNFKRDAYSNGEYFNAIGFEKPYPQPLADGTVRTDMMPRRVAIHTTDERYFVDETFFARVDGSWPKRLEVA